MGCRAQSQAHRQIAPSPQVTLRFQAPCFTPLLILRWPHTITSDVAFVQAHDFRLDYFDKSQTVFLRHIFGRALFDVGGGALLVHPVENDLGNCFVNPMAVSQAKGVGFGEFTHKNSRSRKTANEHRC